MCPLLAVIAIPLGLSLFYTTQNQFRSDAIKAGIASRSFGPALASTEQSQQIAELGSELYSKH